MVFVGRRGSTRLPPCVSYDVCGGGLLCHAHLPCGVVLWPLAEWQCVNGLELTPRVSSYELEKLLYFCFYPVCQGPAEGHWEGGQWGGSYELEKFTFILHFRCRHMNLLTIIKLRDTY